MGAHLCCRGHLHESDRIYTLIVKLASPCNLNCTYCYVYHHEDRTWLRRPKFMAPEVMRGVAVRSREYADRREGHRMSLIFHGGEPTLIGPERFEECCRLAEEVLGDRLGDLAVQTNATLVDSEWVEIFARHRVSVGVSLDGPPEVHDVHRVDHEGRGSHAATLRGLKKLQEGGVPPGIICVVSPGHPGAEMYRYFRSLGIRHLHFLLPHVSHDNKHRLYGRFGATPVADYLIPVFDAWMDEDDPEVKVPAFWGLLRRMMGGPGWNSDFGNPLMSYLVVDTDGSIEALDALKVCQDGIQSIGLRIQTHGFDDLAEGLPLVHQAVHEGFPLPDACRTCPEREVCAGGYLPDRFSKAAGFNNPSVWCADILKILAHIRQRTGLPLDGQSAFAGTSTRGRGGGTHG